MNDPRHAKLAALLAGHSTALKKGDRVLIEATDVPDAFVVELVRAVRRLGALPVVELSRSRVNREVLRGIDPAEARLARDLQLFRIKRMDAFIGVRGTENAGELSDVPGDRFGLYAQALQPVLAHRLARTRWCVLRWPTPGMAQAARMSTEAFEDLFFDVCTMDYPKMARALGPLQRRMKRADGVHLKGPGTDLRFSIKGIGAKACAGERNIPDGEIFSAPVRTSVEGVVSFNTPTTFAGTRFENVRLVFEKGRIVEATGSPGKRLNEILDTDPGARYLGEFSLGLNPCVREPMCDTLFDEKIAGSLHLTPGRAYPECDNGNRSAVHWDLVLIQRPEWGGGEVWFDGELIRKDGLFVPKDLLPLNPSRLRR